MPDDNNNLPNTQGPQTATPFSMPEISDIPPAPENIQTSIPTAPPAPEEATGPDLPPVISPPPAKKKFVGKKFIATILGILILVGGLGAGVVLVKQQQDIRERALYSPDALIRQRERTGECKGRCCIEKCTNSQDTDSVIKDSQGQTIPREAATPNQVCLWADDMGKGSECSSYPINATLPYKEGGYERDEVLNVLAVLNSNKAGAYCSGGSCPQEGDTDIAGYYIAPNGKYYPIATTTGEKNGGGGGGATAQCLSIKAYSEGWTLLAAADLSQLHAGNKIHLCVSGVIPNATPKSGYPFDKAKFTVNGTVRAEVTTKNPSKDREFCDLYEIPAGISSFTIKGQIHHTSLGWK
jgi:hypothetical protein